MHIRDNANYDDEIDAEIDAVSRRLVNLAYNNPPAFVDEMNAILHAKLMEAFFYTVMSGMANQLAMTMNTLQRRKLMHADQNRLIEVDNEVVDLRVRIQLMKEKIRALPKVTAIIRVCFGSGGVGAAP
jgi:protein gp37